MTTGAVATYYDRLGRWNRLARLAGYGGGRATLTVHRALADPGVNGRPTFTRLHDLLVEQLPPLAAPRVLDAGSGLGGTMLMLATRLNANCTGLTLSASQADEANAAALRMGLAAQVSASVRSYDTPPDGPFDLVVAIESLAHSADPAHSLDALIRTLPPGGVVAIVDDMPEAGAEASADLAAFKAGWQCPVLCPAGIYRARLARAGFEMLVDRDLTDDCRPRSPLQIALLMVVNRLVCRLVPSVALRHVMDSHRGGLALERLLRGRLMRYRMLIALRPVVQVS